MKADPDRVKFRKQFFLCRDEQSRMPSRHWISRSLHDGWHLCHHEDLEISIEDTPDFKVVLLGNAYDLDVTSRTNGEVAASLVAAADAGAAAFSGFETRLSRLSGRHAVLAFGRDDDRIYHDACGLKSVFFAHAPDDDLCVGSQPALLAHFGKTTRDDGAYDAFVANPHGSSFSAYFVPYENVTQLLPNRYLSLRQGLVHRFWPVEECREISMQESADTIYRLTKASVEAHCLREKLALTLTGGIDSRMVLAATDPELRERLKILTLISPRTPDHDRWIPMRIAKLLGLDIHQSNISEVLIPDSEILSLAYRNIGEMSFEPSLPRTLGIFEAHGDYVLGFGLCAEVFRDFFSADAAGTGELTGKIISDIAGFKGNELAIPGFERWMSELPDGWESRRLDLLYWEQRVGIWASANIAFREALYDVSPPLNNRSILSAGLCAPLDAQCAPYHLAREVIRHGDPRLLDIPINQDRIHIRLRRKLRKGINRFKSALKAA